MCPRNLQIFKHVVVVAAECCSCRTFNIRKALFADVRISLFVGADHCLRNLFRGNFTVAVVRLQREITVFLMNGNVDDMSPLLSARSTAFPAVRKCGLACCDNPCIASGTLEASPVRLPMRQMPHRCAKRHDSRCGIQPRERSVVWRLPERMRERRLVRNRRRESPPTFIIRTVCVAVLASSSLKLVRMRSFGPAAWPVAWQFSHLLVDATRRFDSIAEGIGRG
jgi:hypothetical protein